MLSAEVAGSSSSELRDAWPWEIAARLLPLEASEDGFELRDVTNGEIVLVLGRSPSP